MKKLKAIGRALIVPPPPLNQTVMSSEILTQIDMAQAALVEAKAQTLAAQAALVYAKETEKKAATAIQLLNKKLQAAVRTERDEAKKPASAGTLAWHAFVLHAQAEQPSRFLGVSKMSEKLAIAKAIREEDECGYAYFVSAWKIKNSPSAAQEPLPLPPSPALSAITLVADVEEALQLAAEEEPAADLAKMNCQQLRDELSLLTGKPTGKRHTPKFPTKALLRAEILRLRSA
jgi:hypothetical protein